MLEPLHGALPLLIVDRDERPDRPAAPTDPGELILTFLSGSHNL